MARFTKLALALAIAALVLAVAVDAKKKDDKETTTRTVSHTTAKLTAAPRTVSKEAPPGKGPPKAVRAPPQTQEAAMPDQATVSKPHQAKNGKGPKQHTVTRTGAVPFTHQTRAATKMAAKPKVAEKDMHPPKAEKREAQVKQPAHKPGTFNKNKVPTVYKGREQPKNAKERQALEKKMKPEARAAKLQQETMTIQNIMNNPAKHRGVTVNHHKGVPHPAWAMRKQAQMKKADKAPIKQATHTEKVTARRRPAAMSPAQFAQEKRKSDQKRAAKLLKHEKGEAKAKAKENANHLKAAEAKKEDAKDHLVHKAQEATHRG